MSPPDPETVMLDALKYGARRLDDERGLIGCSIPRAAYLMLPAVLDALSGYRLVHEEDQELREIRPCEQCQDPACALVAGHWYCLHHVRDLTQRLLEDQLTAEEAELAHYWTATARAATYPSSAEMEVLDRTLAKLVRLAAPESGGRVVPSPSRERRGDGTRPERTIS